MIPKVCYFYWGGGPLSYLQYLSVVSFKKHNPSWKVVLFMPKDKPQTTVTWSTGELEKPYIGKDFIDLTKKLCEVELIDFSAYGRLEEGHGVQMGDFLKWHILYERGGIFSDIDILFIKSVDKLLEQDFDVALSYQLYPATGFMIAKPKQRIFEEFSKTAKDMFDRNAWTGYQALGPEILSKRFRNFQEIERDYKDIKLYNLPNTIVYPYLPSHEVYELFFEGRNPTISDTVGIHWYNGSFVAREYINNFERYRNNYSTMSELIKEYDV